MKFDELDTELAEAGVPVDYEHLGNQHSPLYALVNGPFSSKPYLDILIKHLPYVDNMTKTFIARALTEKGNKKAAIPLLKLFEDETMIEFDLWAVGNAVYVIDDKTTYSMIIELCKNKKLGSSRQMLMGSLARSKKREAYQVLIECLADPSVKAHAIEGLGRFGDPKAIHKCPEK